MSKRSRIWIVVAIVLQVLTGLVHSLSFLNKPAPTNETKKQMIDLMMNYKLELGPYFTPTMMDLFLGLSSCFTFLYLLGGIMNWYLLRRKIDAATMKGILCINTILFGACFLVMYRFTFLPPVVCTGLVFAALLVAFFSIPKTAKQ